MQGRQHVIFFPGSPFMFIFSNTSNTELGHSAESASRIAIVNCGSNKSRHLAWLRQNSRLGEAADKTRQDKTVTAQKKFRNELPNTAKHTIRVLETLSPPQTSPRAGKAPGRC